MESSPYQRLETFWQSKGLKNMSAFAEAVEIGPGTLSAIKQRSSRPSPVVMRAIQQAFPDLSADWVLWGTGPMLIGGRSLAPAATPVEEPLAPFAPTAPPLVNPDVVTAFLGQMAEAARAHREEVQALKKEARADLRAQATSYQYTIDRMKDEQQYERAQLLQRISDLELRCGLRMPTPEEAEAMAAQAPPKPRKAGFKNYEEEVPHGAESLMALSYSNPSFTRLPVPAEAPALQLAA